MIFFDYIFYRISKIYIAGIDEVHPELGGGAVTSLFQFFNLTAILYFLFSITMTKVLTLSIGIPLMIVNWIFHFNKKKLLKCQEKWDHESKKANRIKGTLVIVYLLASIYLYGLSMSRMYQI